MLILLAIFFILHGYNENFGIIPSELIASLFIKYVLISLAIFVFSLLLFRSRSKAFLYSLCLLFIYYFFGAFYDILKKNIGSGFFTSYKFLLPAIFIFVAAIYFIFKKSKKKFEAALQYCSYLLVIITVLEAGNFVFKYFSDKSFNNLEAKPLEIKNPVGDCSLTQKPDIFFIVLDGYTSSACLQEEFAFSNRFIDSLLTANNFFISTGSKSNYNVTPFSLSSTLDMNYLKPGLEKAEGQDKLFRQAIETLKNNDLVRFFENENYQLKNFGCFDFKNAPTPLKPYFGRELYYRIIDDQTLYSRVMRDIGWNFTTRNIFTGAFKVPESFTKSKEYHIYRNQYNWEKLLDEIQRRSDSPRFVYAHLMLPHEPFYLDKNGKRVSDTALILNGLNLKDAYLEQLIYTNKLLAELIPLVSDDASHQRVVIIQGDHGFRDYEFANSKEKEFMNLNAYYFSDHNYSMLYNSISPVNSFRVVLNKYFCQSFPLLKDSSIYFQH